MPARNPKKNNAQGGKSMTKDAPADQALIEAIAKLLNEQNLAEIEIEREDLRVRVTRSYASTDAPARAPHRPACPHRAAPPPPPPPPPPRRPPPGGGGPGHGRRAGRRS